MGSQHLEYAGFWFRLLAMIVDVVLFVIFFEFFFNGSGYFFYEFGDFSFLDIQQSLLILDVYGLIGFLSYYLDLLKNILLPMLITLFFWFAFAATPGKMLIRAKIVDITTGKKPLKTQLIIRYFSYFLSSFFLLGFLWAIFDKKKQGWHDKLARTVVVREVSQKVAFPPS